jgi:hypothetical protein
LLKLFKLLYDEKIESQSTDELYRLISPLAEKGNAEAQYYLGTIYHKGMGVSQNNKKSINWFKKSAKQDYAEAQNELTRMNQSSRKTFERQEGQKNTVSLGAGFGGTLYSGHSDFNRLPVFFLSYERCVIDNLFNEKSALGIGGLIGYSSAKYDDFGWGWTSTDITIGARGALHYSLVDKLDTYAGVMAGYNINKWKWTDDWSYDDHSGNSGFAYSVFAGARYYLIDSLAAFAEFGYGYTYVNVGLSFKF